MAWRSIPMERAVLIGLAEWVVDVLDRLGYLGAVLLIAAETAASGATCEDVAPRGRMRSIRPRRRAAFV